MPGSAMELLLQREAMGAATADALSSAATAMMILEMVEAVTDLAEAVMDMAEARPSTSPATFRVATETIAGPTSH